ncbi:MAG: oligosaccharide flippase family protein [Proteobacteria bacterium]|nr:oligosaccharide flippase family protein [Pseudomonadota bacterium]
MSLMKAAVWMLFGRWAFYFVTLISFSLIVRFISTEAYGVYVIAATFLIFSDVFFADAVENAIVRNSGITSEVARSSFRVVSAFSVAIGAVVALLGIPLSYLYDMHELLGLMVGVGMVVIIQGFASVPRSLLLREKRARLYALLSGASNLLGAIAGVGSAYLGFEAWSLLIQQGVLQIALFGLCSYSARYRPSIHFDREIAAELKDFIRTSFWSCLLNVFANRLDIIFLGFWFGSGVVGVYGLAKRLIQILQELVGSSFDKALVSFKRGGQGSSDLVYRKSVVAQSIVLFPAFAGFALIGSELISLVFGENWLNAAGLVALMVVGGIFRSMVTIERAELVVVGRAGTILRTRIFETILGLMVVVPFARYGGEWMALGFSLRYVIGYLMVVWSKGNSFSDFLGCIGSTVGWVLPSFVATVAMCCAGWILKAYLYQRFSEIWVVLGVVFIVSAFVYLLVLLAFKSRVLKSLREV